MTVEYGHNLNQDIEKCLASRDYNHDMGWLSADPYQSILGADWKQQGPHTLHDLKETVNNVKNTMFCGSNHVFYVSVTPNWPVRGDVSCYLPTRDAFDVCKWDFVLPVDKEVSVRVKTLFRDPAPPFCFFWRGCRDKEDTTETVLIEMPDDVVYASSNKFTLDFNKSCLLNNTMVYHANADSDIDSLSDVVDNDILSLKDEHHKIYRTD